MSAQHCSKSHIFSQITWMISIEYMLADLKIIATNSLWNKMVTLSICFPSSYISFSDVPPALQTTKKILNV